MLRAVLSKQPNKPAKRGITAGTCILVLSVLFLLLLRCSYILFFLGIYSLTVLSFFVVFQITIPSSRNIAFILISQIYLYSCRT